MRMDGLQEGMEVGGSGCEGLMVLTGLMVLLVVVHPGQRMHARWICRLPEVLR